MYDNLTYVIIYGNLTCVDYYEIYFPYWTGYLTRFLCSLVKYPGQRTYTQNKFHISAHPGIKQNITWPLGR